MARHTLLDFFEDMTAQDDLFIVHDDGYRVARMTYREMGAAARAFAAALAARGIGADDKVVVWSENRPEWVVAMWGTLLARAVLVPVDFRASADLVNKIASIVDAKLVLVGAEVNADAVHNSNVERIDHFPPSHSAEALRAKAETRNPEPLDLVEIIFTSGATAEPKGVTITHRNVLANIVPIEGEVKKYLKYMRPFQPIRFLNLLPMSHMFGQSMATFIPPMLGGTVVFSHGYSPAEILHQIKSRRLSVLVCVPKVLDVLREHVERVLPITAEADVLAGKHWAWRWWRYRKVHKLFGWKFWCIVCGAAPLDPQLEAFWRKLGFLVVQGYGLTETAPIVTLNHPLRSSKGTVGRPMHGVDVKIAADGEILVKGDNVTTGYYGRQTDSAFDEDGYFHTGDIGEIDADGRLLIKGRKKEMIVTPQGLNVFPEDVERALLAQPGVKDVAVVGRNVEGEERVHGVLILEFGADERAIVRGANATLEDHQRVRSTSIWPGELLPRTDGTQKLKRREIQRWAAGETAGVATTAAAGASVESVMARFASGRDITPDTSMEELGLSSLDRVELMMALEEAFQTTLDESVLTTTKTVGELKALLGSGFPVPGSGFQVPGSGSSVTDPEPGTRNPEPGTRNPEPEPSSQPRWNRTSLSWFLRRISLPTWILPLARYFLRPLKVDGVEHLAALTGPAIFASNHQSHLDVPVIMLAMPAKWRYSLAPAMAKEFFQAHFFPSRFSRREWFTNSLNYYLSCQFFNAFPLPQREAGTRRTMRYMGEILADDYSILIFPEGKRTEDAIAPFRPGIGMMAARLGVPVVPVRIEGVDKVLHPKWKWPAKGPVKVTFGKAITLQGEDYSALAKVVEDAVKAL
jgi:long-chain acyl-CoA synthetase